MGENSADLLLAVAEAVDHVTALVPPGWRSVTVRLMPARARLVVAKITAKEVIEGQHGLIPDRVGLDPDCRKDLLGDALGRVHEGLKTRGIVWDGLTARVEREGLGDGSPVALRAVTVHGQRVASLGLQRPAPYLLLTGALFDLVEAEAPLWDARWRRFEERFGDRSGWRFVFEDSEVIVEAPVRSRTTCPAQVLGAYSQSESRWTWSWADPTFHDYHYEGVEALRDSHEARRGLGLLRRPTFRCEVGFARMVASLVAHRLDCVVLEQEGDGRKRWFYAVAVPGDSGR